MMKYRPGKVRQTYDALALLALLNVAGVVGMAALLVATGSLNKEKMRAVVEVLRGNTPPTAAAGSTSAGGAARGGAAQTGAAPVAGADTSPALSDMELEVVHREAERINTEIDQRLALANSIMLKVRTEREAFHKERESAAKQEQAALTKQREDGFRKQIAILESLSSKTALEHLLGLNDPDEAAKMLSAMDTSRAKKIVESAKRGQDLAKMKIILRRMEEVTSRPTDELRAEGSGQGP